MNDSILYTIRKMIGGIESESYFDMDLIVSINTSLNKLNQIGVGNKLTVTDETQTWSDFLGDSKDLEGCKSLVYLEARLRFDPPAHSAHIEVIKEQIREIECRLSYTVDPII